MASDVQSLVTARWKALIEGAFGCPIYTAEASPQARPPYAVAEYVTNTVPLNAGRFMATVDAKVSIYAASERAVESILTACGHNSTDPAGFNKVEIGDTDVRATSVIANAGVIKSEIDPPVGGGKCYSRILMLKIRMGAKNGA